jgi:hypothetical protein
VAVVMVLAALGVWGAPSASAADEPLERSSKIVAGHPRLGAVPLSPAARLTDAVTGKPIPGQEVKIWVGQNIFPCTGVTNANGVARCGGPQAAWILLLTRTLRVAYEGGMVGDIRYWHSIDEVG